MEQLNASRFREQCLSLLDNPDPEGIVITRRGKAVARLTPISSDCAGLIGSIKGRIKVKGDILSTGIPWNAQYGGAPRRP